MLSRLFVAAVVLTYPLVVPLIAPRRQDVVEFVPTSRETIMTPVKVMMYVGVWDFILEWGVPAFR